MPSEAIMRRRREVRRRLGEGESLSAIARALGVERTTIRRDSKWLRENTRDVTPPPPEPGHTHALTHGATSQQRIAELEPEMRAVILGRFPWLDDIRVNTLAHRMASHHSGTRWLAEREGVVRNSRGEVWPVALEVEKWGRTIERLIAELEAEQRERTTKPPSIDDYLAAATPEAAEDEPTTEETA